ncbi:hypothetical protein GCM10010156_66170 [Planobispora rosea]|uniref:Uncharacterized protein n=1 Tax=Planobispora rosea TaxID=35762 RepID=A0A8J3S8J0_PLARO|nr:hypothetical protein [Planobispora rosea]GGS98813.1 hypothetical protein GCM10010156_66170 [Planobispora rosea]GIH87981.1 hypothetical protein Pro02_63890 [Planobispora rosea]
MRDPRAAVIKVSTAAHAAGFAVSEHESHRSVFLELKRSGLSIEVRFVIKNLATWYACFYNAEIDRGTGGEPEICWAMRDLLALLAAPDPAGRTDAIEQPDILR